MQVTARAVAFIALAAVAGALAIAGTATPVYTLKLSSSGVEAKGSTSLWRICVKVTGFGMTQEQCQDVDDNLTTECGMMDRWHAMRAFCIMTILVCFLAAVPLGVVDLVNLAALPSNLRKIAMAAVGGVVAVFATVAWALWAGLWNKECNGGKLKDVDGLKWGPMAPLMIVVMVFGIALAIVGIVAPGPAANADAAEPENEQPAGLGIGSPEGDDELQKPAQQPQAA